MDLGIPLAVNFTIFTETFETRQFHYLLESYLDVEFVDNIVVQYDPSERMTGLYQIEVSPSFPFPVDVKGVVKIN